MRINEQLADIGLTKSEGRVYLYILEQGVVTPPKIAAGTGIARTNCYHILGSLKDKGVIVEQARGKRRAYVARDPEALLATVERKREAIVELLPDLRALLATQRNKPKIRFFEGFDEVREIYAMTLSARKVYGLGSTKRIAEVSRSHLDWYRREVKKRGIVFEDILSHPSAVREAKEWQEDLRGLYDYRLVPERYGDFPTDILLWDDSMAVIALAPPIFGTVITSPILAATFRIIFNVMREALPSSAAPRSSPSR